MLYEEKHKRRALGRCSMVFISLSNERVWNLLGNANLQWLKFEHIRVTHCLDVTASRCEMPDPSPGISFITLALATVVRIFATSVKIYKNTSQRADTEVDRRCSTSSRPNREQPMAMLRSN